MIIRINSLESTIEIFYEKFTNFHELLPLIQYSKNALIESSNQYKGTYLTIRLDFIYQIILNMNIKQIFKTFNDLRLLNWSSIYKQHKTILPLHIIQNLAKSSEDDTILPYDLR